MFGIVLHGPETLDTGRFQQIEEILGEADVVMMAGTMGAASVIDSGLQDRIIILRHHLVSDAVKELAESCDIVLIVNMGKTVEGSLRFASVVRHRVLPLSTPIVLIDDGFHCVLNPATGGEWMDRIEGFCPKRMEIPEYRDSEVRVLHGVLPGESIWVDGNVIGKALSHKPRIWRGPEGVLNFDGIEIRPSALAHVGDFDHRTAKIRSGKVRRTASKPFSLPCNGGGRAILIDHQAERAIDDRHDVGVAVTIGDDTTRISGNLFHRFSIPVIGIIDGDEDGICDEAFIHPGSVVFVVSPGKDDVIGEMVFKGLFKQGYEISNPGLEDIERYVRAAASEHLLEEIRY